MKLLLLPLLLLYALAWAIPFALYVALKSRQWVFLKSLLRLFVAGARTCAFMVLLASATGDAR